MNGSILYEVTGVFFDTRPLVEALRESVFFVQRIEYEEIDWSGGHILTTDRDN